MNAYVWKQIFKSEGEPVLTVSLRRPDLSSGKRPLRRIDRYYGRIGDAWKSNWESSLVLSASEALGTARESSRPFQPWSASLDFVVTHEDETTLSLYLDAVVQGPSPHPLIVRSADTWDLKSGTPKKLAAFLPQALQKRRALLSALKTQAANQLSSGESLLFQDVETRIEQSFSPERFYLGDKGPIIFYPMLSLGSAAERIPAFPLS